MKRQCWLFPYFSSSPLAQGSQMSWFCSKRSPAGQPLAARHDGPSAQCRSPVKPTLLGALGPAWSFICTCQSSALECLSPPLPVKSLPARSPRKPTWIPRPASFLICSPWKPHGPALRPFCVLATYVSVLLPVVGCDLQRQDRASPSCPPWLQILAE